MRMSSLSDGGIRFTLNTSAQSQTRDFLIKSAFLAAVSKSSAPLKVDHSTCLLLIEYLHLSTAPKDCPLEDLVCCLKFVALCLCCCPVCAES